MHTKHINICHHFRRNVVKGGDRDIKYIKSEEKPVDIMMNSFPKLTTLNMRRGSCKGNSGSSWKLEGIMSIITDYFME